MAITLKYTEDNWKLILQECADGSFALLDVNGIGEVFAVPAEVTEIRKGAINQMNCRNLKEVMIPMTVVTVAQGAFDGFDKSLSVVCAHDRKPAGFFEGEYIEEFVEDGAPYFHTRYGSWLRSSVLVHSRDCEGRMTWVSPSAEADINNRPKVSWGN